MAAKFGAGSAGDPGNPAERSGHAIQRVLLVSAGCNMAYRIMRCAAAAGVRTYVLGGPASVGLARSRYCRGFATTDVPTDGGHREGLAEAINASIRRWGIDLVLAGDVPAIRSLIAVRDRIDGPCFPAPDLESFDLLNDKWRFHGLCAAAGVPTPETWLFPNVEVLDNALRNGSLPAKLIAKPLSRWSGDGCVALNAGTWRSAIAQIGYAPVLVQRFVEGEDICASVYWERGAARAFIAYGFRQGVYRSFPAPAIRETLERILTPLAVDGVFNFDMRRDREGRAYYLECNPRFFFTIALALLAGVNFVAPGLGRGPSGYVEAAERTLPSPRALLHMTCSSPWRIGRQSWRRLGHALADPIPYLREAFRIERSF